VVSDEIPGWRVEGGAAAAAAAVAAAAEPFMVVTGEILGWGVMGGKACARIELLRRRTGEYVLCARGV
jgi:hypothetical protein